MKKISAMTFGQLMNTLYIKTKIEIFDNDEYIGSYKMDKVPGGYDNHIVLSIWANGDDMVGVKIVRE